MNHIKKVFLLYGLSVLVLFSALWLFLSVESIPGHNELKAYLIKQLTEVNPVPDKPREGPSQSDAVVYVLGGSQKDLKERFTSAVALCKQGPCSRILLFNEPGITEYDPELSRNLTNGEWSIKKMTGLGVKRESLELVSFKKGIFGTFTEAKGLSDIAAQRGYKRIILVTSQCHTKRTWITFSKTFAKKNIALSIQAAHDSVKLRDLLYEYSKFVIYKYILLPNYREQEQTMRRDITRITAMAYGRLERG